MARLSLYTPLPGSESIRLLSLQPGDDAEPLACSMEIFKNYRTAPDYQCISYCWGDANDTTESICNSFKTPITKTLHAALLQLRCNAETGYLWADALCINQKDVAERSQQVSIMSSIFDHGARVLAWLGPRDEHTDIAMTMMKELACRLYKRFYFDQDLEHWLRTVDTSPNLELVLNQTDPADHTNFTSEEWISLWRFYEVPWFRRVWVIREVHRREKVLILCGKFAIDWTLVGLAASWLAHTNSNTVWERVSNSSIRMGPQGLNNADMMWRGCTSRRYCVPFLNILVQTSEFHSSDPRDKIFALLGPRMLFAQPNVCVEPNSARALEAQFHLQVDYTRSALQVFRDVALNCLSRFRDAGILSCSRRSPHLDPSWPSWVPNWGVNCEHIPWDIAPSEYEASGSTMLDFALTQNVNSIVLKGLLCGEVESIGRVASIFEPSQLEDATAVDEFDIVGKIKRLRNLVSRYHDNTTLHAWASYLLQRLNARQEDIYIQMGSMICDCCDTPIGKQHEAFPEPVTLYHCWTCLAGNFDLCRLCYERKGERCPIADHKMEKTSMKAIWLPYCTELLLALKSMGADETGHLRVSVPSYGSLSLFFQTSQGLHGSTSMHALPGDVIVVFFGATVPFLMRTQEDGSYRLVSDCYIERLMNGEAVAMWQRGKLNAQEFEIA